jgi:glycosyltransferase involved in cell wall biosynthesis
MVAIDNYMILSTLDVGGRVNNREHHLVAYMSQRVQHVWVVYRRDHDGGSLRRRLADIFVPRAQVKQQANVTYIAVNPIFNAGQNMRKVGGSPSAHGWRRWAGVLLGEIGILKDLSTIAFLAFFAWRLGPRRTDVASGLSPWGAAAALLLRAGGRVGAVFYEDRDYEPGFMHTSLRRLWAAWIECTCIRHADGGISIGNRLSRLRERQTGRIFPVVTSGIDLQKYAASVPPAPRRRLIYAGAVAPWTALEVLFESVQMLGESAPDLEMIIIGNGNSEYLEALERQVCSAGLADRIRFLGRQSHETVAELLSEGGIGVAVFRPVPLRTYAFPLKILDYMAAGLPIISTSDSESAELLRTHGCGLAPMLDPGQIAAAIKKLLDHPEMYKEMAIGGRKAVIDYDLDRVLNREFGLLMACMAKARQKRANADACPD